MRLADSFSTIWGRVQAEPYKPPKTVDKRFGRKSSTHMRFDTAWSSFYVGSRNLFELAERRTPKHPETLRTIWGTVLKKTPIDYKKIYQEYGQQHRSVHKRTYIQATMLNGKLDGKCEVCGEPCKLSKRGRPPLCYVHQARTKFFRIRLGGGLRGRDEDDPSFENVIRAYEESHEIP